jgi:hypothetical protein
MPSLHALEHEKAPLAQTLPLGAQAHELPETATEQLLGRPWPGDAQRASAAAATVGAGDWVTARGGPGRRATHGGLARPLALCLARAR